MRSLLLGFGERDFPLELSVESGQLHLAAGSMEFPSRLMGMHLLSLVSELKDDLLSVLSISYDIFAPPLFPPQATTLLSLLFIQQVLKRLLVQSISFALQSFHTSR